MAISNNLLNSSLLHDPYTDSYQDRVAQQKQKDEFLRSMQQAQMNAWGGLSGIQQAPAVQQAANPITNPEPSPVLLLLE